MAAMAQAHRTSGHTHTVSPSASNSTATAATMNATSPPSPPGVGPWGITNGNSSCHTCFSDIKAVLTVVLSFSCVAICLLYAARFLLSWVDRHLHRRRAAREPKPASDADDGASAGAGSPVVAGVWAEVECAICLAELIDDDDDDLEGGGQRVRVRVLPACGHGFHAACVEAWLATRASCPTCRAPSSGRSRSSRPSSRTTRQP